MIDVAVIGGGAAGMLSSAIAASRGLNTVLFEKNSYTGKKLGITGKGRCNVTNNCDIREVLENIPTNGRFLYSALSGFSPTDVMEFFEQLGVPLKTERGGRVFPVSDKAADIVNALRRYMHKSGVNIRQEEVIDIKTVDGAVEAVITNVATYECASVIICTGGVSYPLTGSTGDGYSFAEKLGHSVVKPKGSLVPLETIGNICQKMQGLSLKNVTLTAFNKKGKVIFKELGEMLFTHFGISGPLVLSASSHMRNFDKDSFYVEIDLKPGLDEKKLDARLLRDFEKFSNRDFANALGDLVNKKMIPVIIELSCIPPETKVNSITKVQRRTLLELLKGLKIEIAGPRPVSEAIVTSGGISVKEIDPKTMESKIVTGLFFAGEVIDTDAYTGGFNLQIAWSTAFAAANNVRGR